MTRPWQETKWWGGDMSLFPAQVTGPEVLLTAVGSAMAMGQRKIHEL